MAFKKVTYLKISKEKCIIWVTVFKIEGCPPSCFSKFWGKKIKNCSPSKLFLFTSLSNLWDSQVSFLGNVEREKVVTVLSCHRGSGLSNMYIWNKIWGNHVLLQQRNHFPQYFFQNIVSYKIILHHMHFQTRPSKTIFAIGKRVLTYAWYFCIQYKYSSWL